jgi:CheY-like chemotaxis protein
MGIYLDISQRNLKIIEIIKILLVDDDEDDRLFFQEALAHSGINAEFSTVENGLKLIDFLSGAQHPPAPDVIFLDINMPGLNGKACLREIRHQPQFSHTPVIMLTTSTSLKDIDETYKDGANMYICKDLFYLNSEKWMEKLFPSDWRQGLIQPPRENFAFIR